MISLMAFSPRFGALVLLLSLPPAAGAADPPIFRNIHALDAEYELDRRMGEFPDDARDAFHSAETAFRITGGSLNIRHLVLSEDLKARFSLVDGRLWLRFNHRRRLGLERDDREGEVELEWSPARRWFLSFLGEPAFDKSETSAGFAARWGVSEGRSVKLTYLWPGFDSNYAFSNPSINEGFTRFYRRTPQEARLAAHWTGETLSAHAEGRLRRGWEADFRDLLTGEQYIDEGAKAEALLDLRWRRNAWTWGLEGEAWRERLARRHEPSVFLEDRSVFAEKALGRITAERRVGASWRIRAAAALAAARGATTRPADVSPEDGYNILDRIFEATAFHRSGRREWEAAFLYDRQRWETRAGVASISAPVSHNRGKLGFRYDFSERAWIKAAAAVELDRTQSETFFSFDGGTVLLQASF